VIIKKSQEEIQKYLYDSSNFRGYCDAVYIPEETNEIPSILKEFNQKKIPVTISGGGTGLTGARVPQGGIAISTEKLNKILELNKEEKYLIVEPGVILTDLHNFLKEYNFIYPPDPTEETCFIGGTIATNASGEKTFKYGPTRNFVLELEILLANGEKLLLKRDGNNANDARLTLVTNNGTKYNLEIPDATKTDLKNASGYYCRSNMAAIDLFIGSEGTLGIVTKAKLRIIDAPNEIMSCIVFFEDENNALQFIDKAKKESYKNRQENKLNLLDALALEFFDGNSLEFLKEDFPKIPADAKAAVWFEQEISKDNDQIYEQWISLISNSKGEEENSWFGISGKEKNEIELLRKSLPRKINEYIYRNNFRKLGTDTAVQSEKFEEFYNFCKTEVKENNLEFVVFGHVGNSHIHLNMLPKSQEEFERAKKIYEVIVNKAIEIGGTFSAEHGVGKAKKDYLIKMYGKETIKKMVQIKNALDPNWILGRGNIFDV
jgi:D-lactate dehydrogenase (cytochrome)